MCVLRVTSSFLSTLLPDLICFLVVDRFAVQQGNPMERLFISASGAIVPRTSLTNFPSARPTFTHSQKEELLLTLIVVKMHRASRGDRRGECG